jgi:uncharacterized protein YbjT (DUF2867 family)
MRLAVFGATGRLGQQVLRAAQARGHAVAAHSRSPRKQGEGGIKWVTGAVTSALQGADAVIVAFGPRSPADKPFCAIETRKILEAMQRCGVVRILCVTGAMVGRYPANRSWLFQQLASWVQRRVSRIDGGSGQAGGFGPIKWFRVDDLQTAAAHDEPFGRRYATRGTGSGLGLLSAIARCDLARLLVDEAEQQQFNGQAVFVKG